MSEKKQVIFRVVWQTFSDDDSTFRSGAVPWSRVNKQELFLAKEDAEQFVERKRKAALELSLGMYLDPKIQEVELK